MTTSSTTTALALIVTLPFLAVVAQAQTTLKTSTAAFDIDARGSLASISYNHRNLVAPNQPAPLLQLRIDGKDHPPGEAIWDDAARRLTLRYPTIAAEAVIKAEAKDSHITFELISASPADKIDLVTWGPFPTTIGKTIGELVGIVRDGEIAIGIQALNARTQGGEPCSDGWEVHRFQAIDAAHDNLPASLKPVTHFGTTAKAAPFGGILQMHCWEHERSEALFSHLRKTPCAKMGPKIPVRYPGESVVGTKIALFACPEARVLATLETIETSENLPHVVIDGTWNKRLSATDLQYFCFQFGEDTIDDFIGVAKKAGIRRIYHNSPWQTWGHFPLKKGMFPNGPAGLKACVNQAHKNGLTVGMHTLSGFITADDTYVDVPGGHPQLARTEGPASGHIVTDYGKKIYFGNRELSVEIMANCARIINESGVDQWEFDGLECNNSLGLGGYGRDLMLDAWRAALAPSARDRILLGSSAMDNYAWHMFYGGNWGEPWYAPFRQSHLDLRLSYLRFQARNYLPRMLGQYMIHPGGEKPEDIEWLMAMSAGYDAGFSLAFDVNGSSYMHGEPGSRAEWLRVPNLDAILAIIRTWREAQQAGAFTPEIRRQLQDPGRSFHLETSGPGGWNLYPLENNKQGEPIRLVSRTARQLSLPKHQP